MPEPERMLDGELPAALRDALRQARAATGTPERVDALFASVQARNALAAVSQRVMRSRFTAWQRATRWLVSTTLVGVGVGAAYFAASSAKRAQRPAPVLQARDPALAQAGLAVNTTPDQNPSGPTGAIVEPIGTVNPSGDGTSATDTPRHMTGHRAARTQRAVARPAPASQAAFVGSEIELLSRAQALLDHDPRAALRLIEEHAAHYPQGLLGEERDVLRIDAWLALGQEAQALRAARSFVARYPRSTHLHRFARLLEQATPNAATHKTALP